MRKKKKKSASRVSESGEGVAAAPYQPGVDASAAAPGPEVPSTSGTGHFTGYPQYAQDTYPPGPAAPGASSAPVAATPPPDAAYPPAAGTPNASYSPDAVYPPAPVPSPAPKKKKLWIVALVLVLVFLLFLGAGGAAGWVILERRKAAQAPSPSPTEATRPTLPTTPPGVGKDREMPVRPGESPVRPGGGGTEQQSALGFSVTLPSGWSSKVEGNVETFDNGKKDENVALIQVVDQGVSGSDLLAYLNQLNQKLTNEQGYRVESNPQSAKYGQLNAARARYIASSSGYQFTVEIYVVRGPDGRIFQIQNVAVVEFFPSHISEFQLFANSFRFV